MYKRFGVAVLLAVFVNLTMPARIWSEAHATANATNQTLSRVVFEVAPGEPNPNEVLGLVNIARTTVHVPPLRPNLTLGAIAAMRAADMAKRQYYAHRNPEGHYFYDLFPTYQINPSYSCENLDLAFVSDNQGFINEWLDSTTGHRECLLNDQLIEAGYATAKLSIIDINGNATTAYIVVAIHTTNL